MNSKIFVLSALLALNVNADSAWNSFRGPTGRGHFSGKAPVKWTPGDVAWKLDLKGRGQSSAVNAGDRLFLTSASADGSERYVICVDANKGKVLWEQTVKSPLVEKAHKMNSHATPTCVTDGERVIAFYGPAGIHCFDLNGKKQWSKNLGEFPGNWGIAASPIIVDNKVIQNCDATGESSLVALDKINGNELWRTKREDKPRGGWSSPFLIDIGKRKELVLNGEFGVRGYDPESGKELWFCKAFNGRGSPVPDFDGKNLFVVNGKPGDIYSVTPGGSGDVTKSRMAWHAERTRGRDLPSPCAVNGLVIVSGMSGETRCYDAKTGQVYWTERLTENRNEFAGAPLVANGLVYFTSVYGGETVVIKAGKKFEKVATNSVGADRSKLFRATLAPINGKLYSRSFTTLYCINP
ncbi:MAG: PQQ-binding-like beta-propeller repeat protein [Limisphaerales bacterium]